MKRRKAGTTKRKSAKKRQLGKYKSGLEKSCADLLREEKIEFDYEKLEYVLVEKFRHQGVYFKMTPKAKEMKDRTGSVILPIKYTPDFVAKDRSWIIETKGYTPSHHDFTMRWKLFLKHLNDQDEPIPMLFICKNKQQVAEAIQIIKNGGTK
tara:strand:- start:1888 stop:2343 length:456 start_codon:yes stop_codon:yes gene_type:complete